MENYAKSEYFWECQVISRRNLSFWHSPRLPRENPLAQTPTDAI